MRTGIPLKSSHIYSYKWSAIHHRQGWLDSEAGGVSNKHFLLANVVEMPIVSKHCIESCPEQKEEKEGVGVGSESAKFNILDPGSGCQSR